MYWFKKLLARNAAYYTLTYMPSIPVIYISGLFEKIENRLFSHLDIKLRSDGFRSKQIIPYPKKSFGSYSFHKELNRIQKQVLNYSPRLVIGHSLGGYISLFLQTSCPLLLLDPSFPIAKIISHNLAIIHHRPYYRDTENTLLLHQEFLDSLTHLPPIENLAKKAQTKRIHIIGAGKGGHAIAKRYHIKLSGSNYELFPGSDHSFSDQRDIDLIQRKVKRLGI